MEEFYSNLALITAGISLAMGVTSLFIGLKKFDKTCLIFGVMGVCLFIFILTPPIGFIIRDQSPYPPAILIKRIFIFAYYALFPWFILFYTGYSNKRVPVFISGMVGATYFLMMTTAVDKPKPVWSVVALVSFASIFLYGLIAGIWQYRNKEKTRAKWFIMAVSFYGLLFLLTTINQLGNDFLIV